MEKGEVNIPGNLEELKEFTCANVIIKCKYFEVMSIKNYNEIWTLNTMLKGKNIDLENENKVIQNENSELRKKIGLMERVLYKLDDKLSKVKMVVNDMDLVNMNELTD